MKHTKPILILFFIAAAIAAGIFTFNRPKPIPVKVTGVERGTIKSTVVNTRAGTVKVCRRAGLSPAMGGQIAAWPVTEGMKVKKGDLLLALWNDDLRAQLSLAESETEAARSNAEAVCLQADIAERQLDRYLALKESGATTAERLDKLDTDFRIGKTQCKAAQATLEVNRNRIALAAANLDRTFLHAPFDGIIAQLNGELGEYVTPSPVGVQTLPAVDLIDTGCYYVSAPIDEVDAALIRNGMEVRISLDAFRGRTFAGRVKRISDYVLDLEKQARTVEIEVLFVHPEDTASLLPGYSADAEIILDAKENVLRIPTESIMDGSIVYVYDPQSGKLHERRITTGVANWDYTEITSGVTEGEQIILTADRKGLIDGASAELEIDGND
ncbi:MAG: efflux RND transporter periplasmic adaptor subunit [Pseudomonadota bacterium]